MSANHIYPVADEAARNVDPMILANALDHIARSARASRTSTRRLRWIERRATTALKGQHYSDTDFDLPKMAGPNTQEKLRRRMDFHIAIKHQLMRALKEASQLLVAHGAIDADALARLDMVLADAAASIGQEQLPADSCTPQGDRV